MTRKPFHPIQVVDGALSPHFEAPAPVLAPTDLSVSLPKYLRESTLASLNLVPVVGGFLSYIGALFIPQPGKSPEQMWKGLVSALISESLFKTVQQDLVGLTNSAELYRNAVSSGDKEEIRETSISVNVLFTGLLPRFQIHGEEVRLLPLFAIAATMHLSLLRDIAVKGRDIGLNDQSVANYKQQLRNRIDIYTQHADRYAAEAIQRAKTENPSRSPTTRNQPLSAMLVASAAYQISVLDLRDIWQAFDAHKNTGPVSVRLVREIYSPIVGWWGPPSSRAPDRIPDWKQPASRLKTLHIWTRTQWRTTYVSGFAMTYAEVPGQSDYLRRLEAGKLQGQQHTLNLGDDYLSKLEGHTAATIDRVSLLLGKSGRWHRYGPDRENITQPLYTAAYEDHCLSSIRATPVNTDGYSEGSPAGFIFGFHLIDQVPKPISVKLREEIKPKIAPQLLNWMMS
ncbi:MAG TPA: insecticidal delta-endotoxin Cry8Ea1 family protein [Dyella sp.]|uniref:insecticidal delta-endotoxin Cry8Ea1 family protein n=1 Tax=Dyella sp. TaxID=1869338 RepID=UPI002C7E045C|nr:insecticidal delta-endotoxin Cry8Ea1 family protein [Dyella sp.]HUB92054.1 insecticidal delta-endotoxin Cry8Ea1 family protein [Dyella sp.]